MNEKSVAYYRSPIGTLEIVGDANGITSVEFVADATPSAETPRDLADCVSQLDEYFNGARKTFSLDLDLRGTEFQKRVWRELLNIPFGRTVAYLDIARAIGNRNAIRAVGAANGQNPIVIIVPCHRVIGSNGSLTGYGGGLWRKEWLLNFEGNLQPTGLFDAR
ncbi:MAG: methylated-DNA--[protein]-cysteine S-methyltransferase [Chloroflexi bacterium]|nr:methylated-DNA--[protein]-cysteine S-methyltransferase [Chloroflexota bacterium]